MKRIIFSDHANLRMIQRRQDGIDYEDVYAACNLAKEILFKGVPENIKLKGFTAKSGIKFNIVVSDEVTRSGEIVLIIVTVIGLKYEKRPGLNTCGYRLSNDIPYKKRKKMIRKLKRKERKYIEQQIPRYRKDVRNTEESRQVN